MNDLILQILQTLLKHQQTELQDLENRNASSSVLNQVKEVIQKMEDLIQALRHLNRTPPEHLNFTPTEPPKNKGGGSSGSFKP